MLKDYFLSRKSGPGKIFLRSRYEAASIQYLKPTPVNRQLICQGDWDHSFEGTRQTHSLPSAYGGPTQAGNQRGLRLLSKSTGECQFGKKTYILWHLPGTRKPTGPVFNRKWKIW